MVPDECLGCLLKDGERAHGAQKVQQGTPESLLGYWRQRLGTRRITENQPGEAFDSLGQFTWFELVSKRVPKSIKLAQRPPQVVWHYGYLFERSEKRD